MSDLPSCKGCPHSSMVQPDPMTGGLFAAYFCQGQTGVRCLGKYPRPDMFCHDPICYGHLELAGKEAADGNVA